MFDRMPEIWGVTWPRPRPFGGIFCVILFKFAYTASSTTIMKCLVYTFTISCFAAIIMLSRAILTKLAIAHALCHVTHVTCRNNQKFGNLNPDLPVHYTIFRGLRWWLGVVYSVASCIVKRFPAKFCRSENGQKNWWFWGDFGGERFLPEQSDPLENQSPPKHVIWHKKGVDPCKNVVSRGGQDKL